MHLSPERGALPPCPSACAPDGAVRQLDQVRGLMLGVTTERTRSSTVVDVPRGTLVLAYTDGLVEHRGADLDEGTADLLALLAAPGPRPDPSAVTRAAMTLADNRLDDVACISLTLH
ncbi:SpoIIE family protein phosphatase [Geodermatophilus sp. Leaf369]|uniref:SpoIIE family protein phosphatase n=1 Tax=Geodermatophilus sp. Leaf369 TaxID=1736354 RepID=UPI00138F22AD|nr:SpoIIE family protein phosphatase [Geodermatophilus sp. Leaf369]